MMYYVCGEREDELYDIGSEQLQELSRNASRFLVERDV